MAAVLCPLALPRWRQAAAAASLISCPALPASAVVFPPGAACLSHRLLACRLFPLLCFLQRQEKWDPES